MEYDLPFEELQKSWEKVRSNKGAAGADGITIKQFNRNIKENLQSIYNDWQAEQYQTGPYKAFTITKNKKSRKLSIPTVRDRIIHTALAKRLTKLFEPEFESISYGYRPNRSYVHAIRKIEQLRDQGFHVVIDADIKGYFGICLFCIAL